MYSEVAAVAVLVFVVSAIAAVADEVEAQLAGSH